MKVQTKQKLTIAAGATLNTVEGLPGVVYMEVPLSEHDAIEVTVSEKVVRSHRDLFEIVEE